MCNQQTGFRAVEVEAEQASEMVKKAVHSIAERDAVSYTHLDVYKRQKLD